MTMPGETSDLTPAAPNWNDLLGRYRRPVTRSSVWQVVDTAVPLLLLWVAMYLGLRFSYGVTLALAVPAAFLLVRLFIIQHDCGHGSFFRSTRANDALGAVLGVLTLTPYTYWRRNHAIHHATAGNLDRRGVGDVHTLTVAEYRARSRWGRLAYRLYRHPFTLFVVGPVWQFVLSQRLPAIAPRDWRRERRSIVRTDVAIAALVTAMCLAVGWRAFLAVQLPITLLAGTVGVWLFFIQHQFPDTYWERDGRWDFTEAALRGSSYYRLPRVLRWATGNIGLHHIHHLGSRIPNYRLQAAYDDNPALQEAKELRFWRSLRCARLALWDEAARRLVSFREAARAAGGAGGQ